MSQAAFDSVRPLIEAWLSGCQQWVAEVELPEYSVWNFQRDALGYGTVELVDDPAIALGADRLVMALVLDLPLPKGDDEWRLLLNAAEALDGVAVVLKGIRDTDEALVVQVKCPIAEVGAETLRALYDRLVAAKRYLEED